MRVSEFIRVLERYDREIQMGKVENFEVCKSFGGLRFRVLEACY